MPFVQRSRFDWQLRTRSLALGERTRLMAIVNLTPDSFSGDGLGANVDAGVAAAVGAVDGGADIVDLGAESTRPTATRLSADQEQARLLPVLEQLLRERPAAIVSVDTYHASTARAATRAGAEIVNDVSGLLWDLDMAQAVVETQCGLVLMHTRGRSAEWRELPPLAPDDVVPLVRGGLHERMQTAMAAGIRAEKIVLDPGFGFGKIGRENVPLLADVGALFALGRPLLVGLSRKGFVGELVRPVQTMQEGSTAELRRSATLSANVIAAVSGAHILRVHDLQATREAVAVVDEVMGGRV